MYLDLLKQCLTRQVFPEVYRRIELSRERNKSYFKRLPILRLNRFLARLDIELVKKIKHDASSRAVGSDQWPADAETMIGLCRLDSLEYCAIDVLRRHVPGDFVEAGVWRGGAAILMKAVLKVFGENDRVVWAADSFQGLPKPNPERYPADEGDKHWKFAELSVPMEKVKANFSRYGLLDDRVRFVQGWFKDTMPSFPAQEIALLRVDGDLYESTIQVLEHLYPRVAAGGYCVVDDYALPMCKQAVDDFRRDNHIRSPLVKIDWTGVYWQKTG
ncbi:MAG: TylF/MycF/NovP-related O-methyltransferase [Bryobacteraceae bacterium]